MEDQYRPKDQPRPRTRRRTHGKASPLVAILIALVLIALVVTAVICMLRKPAMPTQGNANAGSGSVPRVMVVTRQKSYGFVL
jgi:hypothetical protein